MLMYGDCSYSLSNGVHQSKELSAVRSKIKHTHSIHNNQGGAPELLRR